MLLNKLIDWKPTCWESFCILVLPNRLPSWKWIRIEKTCWYCQTNCLIASEHILGKSLHFGPQNWSSSFGGCHYKWCFRKVWNCKKIRIQFKLDFESYVYSPQIPKQQFSDFIKGDTVDTYYVFVDCGAEVVQDGSGFPVCCCFAFVNKGVLLWTKKQIFPNVDSDLWSVGKTQWKKRHKRLAYFTSRWCHYVGLRFGVLLITAGFVNPMWTFIHLSNCWIFHILSDLLLVSLVSLRLNEPTCFQFSLSAQPGKTRDVASDAPLQAPADACHVRSENGGCSLWLGVVWKLSTPKSIKYHHTRLYTIFRQTRFQPHMNF